MKIVDIFAKQLFAFYYDNEDNNEFDRLIELWTDVEYLKSFAEINKINHIEDFINDISYYVEQIQDLLYDIESSDKKTLEYYFRPLHDQEMGQRVLSLQKGKVGRNNSLRIYAIKIYDNCFIITGGAIKMSQKMQDHPDTKNELIKLDRAKSFLKENGVMDIDSFYELIEEIDDK